MTSINKNKPTTTTTNTQKTEGPKGPSKTEAPPPEEGVEGIEDARAQTSWETKDGLEAKKAGGAAARETTKTSETVPSRDPSLVGALLSKAIGQLEPGEKITIGGKIEAAEELAVEGEVKASVKRREDGRYEVRVSEHGFVGGGAEGHEGPHGIGAKVGFTGGGEVVFVANTQEEATSIAADVVGGAAAGNLLLPGGAVVGGAAGIAANAANLTEVKVEAGMKIELEGELGHVAEAAAGAGGSIGLAYDKQTGEVFLEMAADVEGGVERKDGVEGGLSINPAVGEAEGRITVRVPLGKVGSAEELNDPEKQKELLSHAQTEKTTMSFVGEVDGSSLPAGVVVEVSKTIEGTRLDELFDTSKGWETRVDAAIGPRLTGGIGPASGDIGVRRTVTLASSTPEGEHHGDLNAELNDVAAHKSKLENENLKLQAKHK